MCYRDLEGFFGIVSVIDSINTWCVIIDYYVCVN